jgi:GWxTD domain-containing protein
MLGGMFTPVARAVEASLSYTVFKSPTGPYLELSLHLVGSSLTFAPAADSLGQVGVEMIVLFQRSGTVATADRLAIHSPLAQGPVDFVAVQRYPLEPGSYDLQVQVQDIEDETNQRIFRTEVFVPAFPEDRITQSDPQLLASISRATSPEDVFAKSGWHLEPLPYNYYGRGTDRLYAYGEFYGVDTHPGTVVICHKVERLSNGRAEVVLQRNQKGDRQAVLPVLSQLDIRNLPSGNYQFALELRSAGNELISRREIPFQRSNPDLEPVAAPMANQTDRRRWQESFVGQLSLDTLRYSLRAITPLIPNQDQAVLDLLIKGEDTEAQRMYLYRFWATEHPGAPEAAYREYMGVARAIDQQFQSGFRHGFETDRGYVYLKYGRPNDRVRDEADPVAPPYEVWSYDYIPRTGQSNVRFIFYNPSLAADDFLLLHSDVFGERQNPQWEVELYRQAPGDHPADYFQGTRVGDGFGRRARKNVVDW